MDIEKIQKEEMSESTILEKKSWLYEKLFCTRLYPKDLLYCEGRNKPTFRGKVHLYAFFMIPFVLLFLWNQSKTTTAKIMSVFVSVCIALCLGVSGMYHRCNLNKEQEILYFL